VPQHEAAAGGLGKARPVLQQQPHDAATDRSKSNDRYACFAHGIPWEIRWD
jgi:hypothetical protein